MDEGGSSRAGIRRISSTTFRESFKNMFIESSSSLWSNDTTGVEMFPNNFSFHQEDEEDDEEALKWAAIQKLPTVARMRRGLLATPEGVADEVCIPKLRLQERRALLERLVRVAGQEDTEKFFLKLQDRIERVGITLPTIEVRFEHLKVEAEVHLGTRALPTFANFILNIVQGLLRTLHVIPTRKQQITILQDVSGIIRPARTTLLLGAPGSGKTTLLLALAGKLDSKLKFNGKVTYNGHEMNEFIPQRTAAYVSQHDLHIGEMTVRETLAFAARVQGVGIRYDLLQEVSRREKEKNITPDRDVDVYMKAVATEGQKTNLITDFILKVLGLEVCADTIVGNAMLRGISGGQRKLLTTGEVLVGSARALFMDEISTGLDSSTTFRVVNSVKHLIHSLKGTAVVSLLQPAPETYNLFDDIILLSDGHIVYQGPREHVLEFFAFMGFKCPERKGVADFLQEVTSRKDQEQYWVHKDQPYEFVTPKEFAEALHSFHVGISIDNELATHFDKSKSHPAALATKLYGIGKWELLKACFSREYLLMKRNSFIHIFKLCQIVVVAFIVMTIFFRTNMHRDSVVDGGIYVGAMYYCILLIVLNGFADLTVTISKLPMFYKQRNLLFFPSWVYVLPEWILKLPITFTEVGIWVFLTYYVIGFDPDVGRFFRQFLLLVLVNQMATAEIQGVSKIKDGYNPATWMLEVTSLAKEMELGIDFAQEYKNSSLYRRNKELINELSIPVQGSKDLYFPSKYSRSFFTQCMACLWKQHWSYWRNPPYTAIRFLYTIAVALLFGTVFWNLGSKIEKRQDLFNAMGSMYAAVLLLGIRNSSSAQPLVFVERTVFYREKAAGMYSAFAYAFSQVVIELPYVLLQAVVYGIIVYAMIGFEWTVTKIFWYLFFMYFTFLYFTYYGMMAAAMTPTPPIAVILSSGFYQVWNLFSGFAIPRPRIPVWWRWYYWGNPVAWTLYGLVASQFGDMQDTIAFNGKPTTVEDFLRNYFGFKHDFLGVVGVVIIGFAVTFALVFAIAIKMFNFQRR
ncbi:hypothetical protein Ahy_B06g081876 isoform C [Arachis hypogaea]|uniref:ABC transporter domain-containing protein n=1 Tax=Arachis hypogaea TaxID=3818 RepID=A0A444YM66_ARAHY|nr:hypothetical protein Ahy_B06g081876 isoform C [Arachis hypogaea]